MFNRHLRSWQAKVCNSHSNVFPCKKYSIQSCWAVKFFKIILFLLTLNNILIKVSNKNNKLTFENISTVHWWLEQYVPPWDAIILDIVFIWTRICANVANRSETSFRLLPEPSRTRLCLEASFTNRSGLARSSGVIDCSTTLPVILF